MKTQNFFVGILILLLFINCSKENPNETNSSELHHPLENEKKNTVPANLISLEKAKEQLDFYNGAHPQEVGSEYALRTWISIEDLKAYIVYIEKVSEDKGIKVSGIDIIHTQYKEVLSGTPNPDNSTYEKTLMLAPTYKKGQSNIAFDPLYSENGEPMDLKTLLQQVNNEELDKKGTQPGASSIANGMTSCPNNCP